MKSELQTFVLLGIAITLGSMTATATSGCMSQTSVAASTENDAASTENDAASSSDSGTTPTATKTAVVNEVHDPEKILGEGGDWPQWGGTRLRNNTPTGSDIPDDWNIGKFDRKTGKWDASKSKNIKWVARLGSQTYGNPVIADKQIYVGTNNSAGYIKRYPGVVDLGCLLCFSETDGSFLWQHSSEKLPTGRVHDWPLQGICSAPLVEGDRAWFVTSRGEIKCLDTKGFYDGEDDGPTRDEPARVADIERTDKTFADIVKALDEQKIGDTLKTLLSDRGETLQGEASVKVVEASKKWTIDGTFSGIERQLTASIVGPRLTLMKKLTVADKREADTIWTLDMMQKLGVSQHNMCSCSPTTYGDLMFIATGNGVDESHINIPSPNAPSFMCINKNDGAVIWTDSSPSVNIMHGQWSSPTVAELGGEMQVLFAGGDGWLYSFKANEGKDGQGELLWKFDCNPKDSIYALNGATRNHLIGTPAVYNDRVYIAVGEDPEHGEGEGHLWCIDPTKRGDVSPDLVVREENGKRVEVPYKRIQAADPQAGDRIIPNPNSAVIWQFNHFDANGNNKADFAEIMHRTLGSPTIKDDRLYIADLSGVMHCLDPDGGEEGTAKWLWSYDMLSQSWSTPMIVDGKVYMGDEQGEVAIFEHLGQSHEPIAELDMGTSVYTTPVVANGVLYISSKDKLFAIEENAKPIEPQN
jgi:hypothetical protein